MMHALLLLPVSLLTGYVLLHQADRFIAEKGGQPLPARAAAALLWGGGLTLSTGQWLHPTDWPVILKTLLLVSFMLQLSALDLANNWLPLEFCLSLSAAGLLFTLLPGNTLTPTRAIQGAAIMLVLMSLTWWGLNRLWQWRCHNPEAECLGFGDVLLLCALCCWLPLPCVSLLATGAWCLLLLHSVLQPGRPALPVAPYLLFCLCCTLLSGAPL